ncbi:hypothetical protein BDV3_003111 [Batrachochytrium dendrobatidis]
MSDDTTMDIISDDQTSMHSMNSLIRTGRFQPSVQLDVHSNASLVGVSLHDQVSHNLESTVPDASVILPSCTSHCASMIEYPQRQIHSSVPCIRTLSECIDETDTQPNKRIQSLSHHNPSNCIQANACSESSVQTTVIMAICCRHNRMGAALLNGSTSTLQLFEDVCEDSTYQMCRSLLFQTHPTSILTFARADQAFIRILEQAISSMENQSCELLLRPTPEFSYESGKSKLLSIQLAHLNSSVYCVLDQSDSKAKYRTRLQMLLEGIVVLDHREMVGAAGALLTYLAKTNLTRTFDYGDHITIQTVENISLENTMQLSVNAMTSLHIFQEQGHPNIFRQAKRESLSLFGILNFSQTQAGKMLLKQWIMRPLLDLDTIKERHDSIEWFIQQDLSSRKMLQDSLRRLRNIPILDDVPPSLFQQLSQHINDIDFDMSKEEARLVVKQNVDEDLDSFKKTYSNLETILSTVATTVAQTVPQTLSKSLNIVYFPQLGYLVAISNSAILKCQSNHDYAIDGLLFQFSTATMAYYKSDMMYELDDTLGDIHSMIVDRELEVVQQLREVMLDHGEYFLQASRTLTELECILSLTEAAVRYKYTRPTMTHESGLHIIGGRHPLKELCIDAFIENDTHIGCSHQDTTAAHSTQCHADASLSNAKMMLITGANFSGKSVYLQQVALIVIMSHIGSFVPASFSTIGLTDRIFTRIHSDDSVSALKGSFLIDLQQMSYAVVNSSPRSLVIVDEFGKGTISHELLMDGVLDCMIPSVYSGHDCMIKPTATIDYYTMRIIETHDDESDETYNGTNRTGVTFLYQLIHGKCLQSLGVHCAQVAGLPKSVIDRAQQVSECVIQGEPIPMNKTAQDHIRQQIADRIYQVFQECNVVIDDLQCTLWSHIEPFESRFQ